MNKKIVIVGGGVAGINAATKLVDNGYPGELITIIDAGQDPYNRPSSEVMKGFAGAGLFSDGKYVYAHNSVGGHLDKYCGEERADELVLEGLDIIKRFHSDPSKIMFSNPLQEPEYIKPYFNLKMTPTWHIGTNYLHELGKKWYDYLVEKGIRFIWEREVHDINFDVQLVLYSDPKTAVGKGISYDTLIFGTGKSGIDLTQKLITKYNLKKEPKSVQLGVRFEAPQKYFQKLVDVSYDFKLTQRPNEQVSLRTFCTNNNAAYVAEEETYGMKSYNGHSFKQEDLINNMTNFGIIMEIKGIENPFDFQKDVVKQCQVGKKGLYYSPNKKRQPSKSAEGEELNVYDLDNLDHFQKVYEEYADHIINFISDLNKVFEFGDDYGIYIPEVKFLSEEVLVNYEDLSLVDYPNIHFIGDSLSARGIAVSASQGLLCASSILKLK